MRLPNAHLALAERSKIIEYLLNPAHPVAPQLTVVTLPLPLLVAVSAWVDVLGAWVRSKGAGGP
jgi:hypothetical protein